MDQITIIGTSGATLILIAFILNQTNRWKGEYFIYDFTNFIGSALLIAYAILLSSWPFLVLNLVWAAVSLKDIFTDLKRNSQRTTRGFFNKWMK